MTREQMIADLEAADKPAGPTREQMIADLEKHEASAPTWKDRLKQAAGYAVKPLDYMGGVVRTGVGATAQDLANMGGKLKAFATGEDYQPIEAVSDQDMRNAFMGSAPTSNQMLEKAGVPEGGSLSDIAPALYSKDPSSLRPTPHGSFDPTARGTVGMGLDIATDPLTYLGAGPLKALLPGGRAGAVADHILNPAENALKAGGKTIYKSAPIMKAADAVNERYAKGAASDILFDQGITGTGRQVARKAEALADTVGQQRNALLSQADAAGGMLNMNSAMSPAEQFIQKVRASRDPALLPLADALEGRTASYKALNPAEAQTVSREIPSGILDAEGNALTKTVTQEIPAVRGVKPSEGSGFKTSLYNDTGNAAWDTLRKTPQGDIGNKALARGLDRETSAAAERAIPGMGGQIDNLNDTWGALLTPKKALESEALKGERKNFLTSVDAPLAVLTHSNPAVIAAKKTSDLLKTNWLRTNVGRGAYQLGDKVPLLDELLRREAINSSSDWQKLQK